MIKRVESRNIKETNRMADPSKDRVGMAKIALNNEQHFFVKE